MPASHFIIGTAGHIDHGKSSLVEALSGTNPDRLPEEKARGMTIDLGFAHLNLPHPQRKDDNFSIGLIDVPGHADFVKNMVAGVVSIDLALFIVAADDGWMPQSEEHLQILSYLGVKRAAIAMTKVDLVDDPEFSAEMIRDSLQGTIFADAPIFPTAAPTGQGIAELKAGLAALLAGMKPNEDIGKPRLPVDRTFSPQGIGTVVTGTLTGGKLEKGMEVVLQPRGQRTHLRGLQNHSKNAASSVPGTRTAANLADVGIFAKGDHDGVARGDVVTLASLGTASDAVDVLLEKSAREVPFNPASNRPLKNGQKLYFHHGGTSMEARIYFLGTRQLNAGERVFAQLRCRQPVYAFHGDRFVLRDFSKQATVAGGVILDADASRVLFRKARQRLFLEQSAECVPDLAKTVLTQLQRDHAVLRSGILLKSHFSQQRVDAAVQSMVAKGQVIGDGPWLIDEGWWKGEIEAAGNAINAFNKANPQLPGMDVGEFAAVFGPRMPDRRLVDLLVAHLPAHGFLREGKYLRSGQHQLSLPPHLKEAGSRIQALLKENPLEPPNLGDLVKTPADRQAMKFLIDSKEAIILDDKTAVLVSVYNTMQEQVVAHLQAHKQATASDLRQVVGTTRRILMPFLEKLDKTGITKRNGDFRVLK
jgi:selenocysteine-specific elongation factor